MRRALWLLLPLSLAGCNNSSSNKMDSGAQCASDGDCPAAAVCETVACKSGACVHTPLSAGALVGTQAAGDCKRNVCDGHGAVTSADDPTDVQSDGNPCTADTCVQGTNAHPPVDAGTPCGSGLALSCDGAGNCTGCTLAAQCPAGNECKTASCLSNGMCSFEMVPVGTATSTQTSGDCKKNQCDGQGHQETVNDDTDVAADSTSCTADSCSNGTPVHAPVQGGTPCSEDGGSLCDSFGACVECLVPTDCAGVDGTCSFRACNGGRCGVQYADAGTPLPSQTAGDCQLTVCTGDGGITQQNDDLDLPEDNNDCTFNQCSSGVPQFPPVFAGTFCGATLQCDGMGNCVGCLQASDCGDGGVCRAPTCNNGACGLLLADAGTAVPSQIPGDCLKNVCDSQGNVVSATDDLDLPADDGNDCTTETCSNGVAAHQPLFTNTACATDGGHYCDSFGSCVECNFGSQCTSMVCAANSTCAAPTCNDGVKNGSETDIDCGGGACAPCGVNKHCGGNGDCATGTCSGGTCVLVCTDSQAPGETCMDYCSCMTSTCPSKFADLNACLTACGSFVEAQLCCRGYHCTAAMTDPVTHCPHAAGEAICP